MPQIVEGALVRLKSGTEGWIKGQIVEYTDLITYPPLGVAIYTGPGYKVYILEGKHKGETIRVPENYVESYTGPAQSKEEPLYPHVPKNRQPQFPHVPKGRQPEIKLTLPQTRRQFVQVGERVRFIGSSRGRYETWPKDAWLEKGVTGTVKEYHPEQPAVRVGGEYFEALRPYAVIRWDFGGDTVIDPDDEEKRWERIPKTEEMSPMTATTKSKPTRHDVEIGTWAERDRIGIWLTDKRTDKAIAEWWDEDAQEMFDQGFFKPGDIRHQTIMGRAFEDSVLEYAESVGILAGIRYLPQAVLRPKDAYYWTAVNKDTGEIVESFTPYTSSGRALRGGKAYATRHWKSDTALVEVWRQPHRYSENLEIQPVEKLTLGG